MKNNSSKIKIVIIFVLLICCNYSFSQQKEWENLLGLLQKEASYFNGKKGFFRLAKTSFTNFEIQEMALENETVTTKMHLTNRFFPESDAYSTEVMYIDLFSEIQSVQILYDYTAYFNEYPNYLFLMIKFKNKEQKSVVTTKVQNPETGLYQEDVNETYSDRLIFPIRSKNREKIFKAFDAYLATDFKTYILDADTYH